MSVAEAQRKVTSHEFSEWIAYFQLQQEDETPEQLPPGWSPTHRHLMSRLR